MLQVIYVSGPNSQQIFQQSAKALHFVVPSAPIYTATPTNATETATETATEVGTESTFGSTTSPPAQAQVPQLPQINYFRAEVLPPHTRIVVGELPLITYSILTNGIAPQTNKSDTSETQTGSTTEEPAAQKEDNDAEKSESSITVAPSSSETDSSSSSEATSTSEDDATKNEKGEGSTEEPETTTETADKTDS